MLGELSSTLQPQLSSTTPPQATLPGSRAASAHPVPGRLRRQPGDPDLEPAGLQPASPRPPGRRARRGPARATPQVRTHDDGYEPGPLSPTLSAPAVPRYLARAQGRRHPDPRDGGCLVSSVEVSGHAQTGGRGDGVSAGRVGREIARKASVLEEARTISPRSVQIRGRLYPKRQL